MSKLKQRKTSQLVAVNCKITEYTQEDSFDAKTKKPIRKITINKECNLVPPKQNEGKLTLGKSLLKKIIQEEFDLFLQQKRKDNPSDRERKEFAFGKAYTELDRLSKGIYEETDNPEFIRVHKKSFLQLLDKCGECLNRLIPDEEMLDEKCGDNIPGNRRHKADGTFGSKENNTSWSLQKKGCGASQMKPGSNVRRATRLACGSVAREQGKDVPCKGKKNK